MASSSGTLEPIRMKIRFARATLASHTKVLRKRLNIKQKSLNTLKELVENTPMELPTKPTRTKENTMTTNQGGRPSKKSRMESLLKTCDEIIVKCFNTLEANDWKNVRPSDLLAFMVLAKDIVKDLEADNKAGESELDNWIASVTEVH